MPGALRTRADARGRGSAAPSEAIEALWSNGPALARRGSGRSTAGATPVPSGDRGVRRRSTDATRADRLVDLHLTPRVRP